MAPKSHLRLPRFRDPTASCLLHGPPDYHIPPDWCGAASGIIKQLIYLGKRWNWTALSFGRPLLVMIHELGYLSQKGTMSHGDQRY